VQEVGPRLLTVFNITYGAKKMMKAEINGTMPIPNKIGESELKADDQVAPSFRSPGGGRRRVRPAFPPLQSQSPSLAGTSF
jgi:hypothetical protein